MGLSASQVRYLSLTAKKSDLEYQAQMINNARTSLANKSSEVSNAYVEGMNNKVIRIASYNKNTDGTSTKVWSELTFANAASFGYHIVGISGNSLVPSPYVEYVGGQEISEATFNTLPSDVKAKFQATSYDVQSEFTMYSAGTKVSEEDFKKLYAGHKGSFNATTVVENGVTYHIADTDIVYTPSTSPMTLDQYNLLSDANKAKCAVRPGSSYKATGFVSYLNPNYNGMDIQSLLVSGQAQIVSTAFFQFLCDHGYGTGHYYEVDEKGNKTETTYEKLLETYQNTISRQPVVDWRSDVTSTFKQDYYTEDDAAVLAKYEADTAEIQAQDKQLELQLKRIETEHKAIDTEMEAVKKVMDKNIENSFKTFG